MAFPWFRENQNLEKDFFGEGKKNYSRIKTSNASYIFFNFLTTRPVSNREIKKTKTISTLCHFFGTRQNLNRDFCSVSENDSTILSPVIFWMEVFTFQTLKQKSFHKENLLEKEQIFYQNFRDKTWFWNKLSQRFRMRIKNFETCQVLKSKTATHGNLKGKYFQEIIVWGKLCFSKSIFCIILHCKKVKFCIFVPCWKTWKEKKRIRKTNSNKIFQKFVWFRISFFTWALILKRETENVAVFQPTFYNSSNFE